LKNKLILLLITCVLSAFTGCGTVTTQTVHEQNPTSQTTAPQPTATEQTTTEATPEEPVLAEVVFLAAGDNLIHSSLYKQAAARADGGGYDFAFAYQNIADLISVADIAVINQETIVSDLFPPSTYPRFNSPTALGDHMIELGFNVFTIANNHTLDMGEQGLLASLDYWDGKENIVVAGVYRNAADRDNIRTNTVNGITFSYLSYAEQLNGLSLPEGSPVIIGRIDSELMVSEIKKAKSVSDFCVVALHWGVEDSPLVSDSQRALAQILAEAGADIIIGTHPHVLRDIELLTRADGTQALCAYSLGNFISAQNQARNLIGGVLQFKVTMQLNDNDPNRRPVISGIEFIPLITHFDGSYQNVRLYKFSEYTPALAEANGVKRFDSKFSYDYIGTVLKEISYISDS